MVTHVFVQTWSLIVWISMFSMTFLQSSIDSWPMTFDPFPVDAFIVFGLVFTDTYTVQQPYHMTFILKPHDDN